MVYRSKHDICLGILLFGITIFTTIKAYLNLGISIVSILMTMILLILIWSWVGTRYIIGENTLNVKSGPVNVKFEISEIREIRDTKNFLSCPACSLDRIEIIGDGIFVIISPKKKEEFIKHIQEKNSIITYVRKSDCIEN